MRGLACAAVALALPALALAHGRSVSYSRWTLQRDGATVELRLARGDLARAGLGGPGLESYAAARLRLLRAGAPCQAQPARLLEGSAEWVVLGWSVRCPGAGALTLESRLLAEAFPQHLHFARLAAGGGPPAEIVLQASDGAVPVGDGGAPETEAPLATLARFVALGIEHIATGWDHLAFIMALLLLAASLREVLWLATGFTIAHSVTLALAVTGVLRPDQQAVEALIGFSIALVAAENVWLLAGRPATVPRVAAGALVLLAAAAWSGVGRIAPGVLAGMALFTWCHFGLLGRVARPARLRVAVAFAFGLIHGFGFAGVLSELALPAGHLALALGGFNAGVELGQLVVVALAWPLLHALARAGYERRVADVGSSVLCGLGVFWLVVRTFAR
ncbi:MAG TPA: HupE/UreJ family protein [Candidatus Limnocylindria bacterium]|nr:HupE/UreJ family protein [Candidatus Limnocylindria bacterium]